MVRQTRAHKPHGSHAEGVEDLPLSHTDELRRLARVYEAYAGIAGDLRQLLVELERRQDVDGAAITPQPLRRAV